MKFNSSPSSSVKYLDLVFSDVYLRSALRILLEKWIESICSLTIQSDLEKHKLKFFTASEIRTVQ